MNTLTKQNQGTAKNGLSTEAFDANHRHLVSTTIRSGGATIGYDYGNEARANRLVTNGEATTTTATKFATATTVINTNNTNIKNLSHSHTVSSTDTETRPDNFTVRIWKRTA